MNSRSGGIFVSASDWILKLNGVVYGCILDENMRAKNVRATKVEDRNKMCKSKYVESNVNNTFEEVEEDLKNGKKVFCLLCQKQPGGNLTVMVGRRHV